MPGYANPQAFNRYSYVLNMPISATDPSGHKCVGEAGECETPSGAQINGTGSKANTAKFPAPTPTKPGGGGSGNKGGGKNDGKTTPKAPIQKEKSPYSDVTGLESSPVDFSVSGNGGNWYDIYVGGVGSNGIGTYVPGSNGLSLGMFDSAPQFENILFAKKGGGKKGGPKPPGWNSRWKKKDGFWIDPKTGDRWKFGPEDEIHNEHWDLWPPGKNKIRVPIDPRKGVFK